MAAAAVALSAAVLLVGAGYAGQSGGSKTTDFDPKKKDAWRFLDDDLDEIRIEAGKAQERGDYQTAARHYLAYLYRNSRDARVIYNLARCYGRMGDADAAAELLTRAAERGFAHPELLQSDTEFDPIRSSRAFRNHQKALAGLAGTLGQTMAVSGPRVNLYRLRLPASYDAAKAYPLVVGLHGNGSNADNMMQSMPTDAFEGMICAAPEGAYSRTDLASPRGAHFSWYLPDADRALRPLLDAVTSEQVLRVVDDVSQRHRVSRVVLLGFSQGVSVAYLTAMKPSGPHRRDCRLRRRVPPDLGDAGAAQGGQPPPCDDRPRHRRRTGPPRGVRARARPAAGRRGTRCSSRRSTAGMRCRPT